MTHSSKFRFVHAWSLSISIYSIINGLISAGR